MKNEPTAMREVHEIRAQIYEETKDMTPEERAAHASQGAQELVAMYSLIIKRPDAPIHSNAARLSNDANHLKLSYPAGYRISSD